MKKTPRRNHGLESPPEDRPSPAQLAAVSCLARYSGHTQDESRTQGWTGSNPVTMPITVPVLRVWEACRGQRTSGRLLLRPLSGNPIDRRDTYRLVTRVATVARIPATGPRLLRLR